MGLDAPLGFSVCVISSKELWVGLQERDIDERRLTNRWEFLIDAYADVQQVFSSVHLFSVQLTFLIPVIFLATR